MNEANDMKGENMKRDQQDKNTKYFYITLAVIGLLVVITQALIYIGYTIAECI